MYQGIISLKNSQAKYQFWHSHLVKEDNKAHLLLWNSYSISWLNVLQYFKGMHPYFKTLKQQYLDETCLSWLVSYARLSQCNNDTKMIQLKYWFQLRRQLSKHYLKLKRKCSFKFINCTLLLTHWLQHYLFVRHDRCKPGSTLCNIV